MRTKLWIASQMLSSHGSLSAPNSTSVMKPLATMHHGMLQHAEMARQLDPAHRAGEADGEDHQIGAQPRAPGERERDGDFGQVHPSPKVRAIFLKQIGLCLRTF